MKTLTELILQQRSIRDVFTDVDVVNLLGPGSPARRHALVKRALAAGEIVRVKRGLYLLAEPHRRAPPNLFVVAGRIYGPSYVGLESALAEHGWIPERVSDVVSGVFRRSVDFTTPPGRFVYRKTPFQNLAGVERVETPSGDAFLLATPLRALADLAHDRGLGATMDRHYLVHSLRVDPHELSQLKSSSFDILLRSVARGPARHFLQSLREELDP